MSSLERRKLLCSVTFHAVAILCVIWSLYVLIDRTTEEIRAGQLQWPFWTKLVVVAVGFTGGLVFMYIQCKVYVHLCRKWKAYNRIIVVQDAPEGVHKPSGSRRSSWRRATTAATSEEDKNRQSSQNAENTPASPTGDAEAAGPSGSGGSVGRTSNAETQTALRGVSIVEVTVKRSNESGANASTPSTDPPADGATATLYFAECEVEANARRSSRDAEPILLCDLPGAPSEGQGEGEENSSVRKSRDVSTLACDGVGLAKVNEVV